MFAFLKDTRKLVMTAMMVALGFILSLIEIPTPFLGYLNLDPSEIVVLVTAGTLGVGPLIVVVILKSVLRFMIKSTLIFGELAAIIASFTLGFTYLGIKKLMANKDCNQIQKRLIVFVSVAIAFFVGISILLFSGDHGYTWIFLGAVTVALPIIVSIVMLIMAKKVYCNDECKKNEFKVFYMQAIGSIMIVVLCMTVLNFLFITPSNALTKFASFKDMIMMLGSVENYFWPYIAPIIPFNLMKYSIVFIIYYFIKYVEEVLVKKIK